VACFNRFGESLAAVHIIIIVPLLFVDIIMEGEGEGKEGKGKGMCHKIPCWKILSKYTLQWAPKV
jgi:hypothetical protein